MSLLPTALRCYDRGWQAIAAAVVLPAGAGVGMKRDGVLKRVAIPHDLQFTAARSGGRLVASFLVTFCLVAFLVTIVSVAAGCRPAADIQQGDLRTYTVPRSTSPAPRPSQAGPPKMSPAETTSAPKVQYDLPAGWVDVGASGMRLATLRSGPGGPEATAEVGEITVIPASGTLQGNATRWQEQLTPSADPDRVARAIEDGETVPVNGVEATILLLLDDAAEDQQAILAAVIPVDPSTSLFVKFKGTADLARKIREPFTSFVRSIRWQ